MTDPVETSEPVADAPAAEAQSPVERAVARMEGKFSGDAPAVEGEPAPVEGQPAPEEDGFDLPTLTSLQATAEQRATERAERERLQAPITELRAHIDQQLQGVQSVPLLRQQLQASPHEALTALGLDPAAVAALLGKSQEPPDPVQALERLLDRKFAERDAAQKQAPVAPASAAPPLPEAEAIFAEYVAGAGDRFPKLAALPSNMRSGVALRYLEQARTFGHDPSSWTDEQIARAVERELTSSGTPPSTTGAPASSPGTKEAANGGPTPSAPRSITNGHAAQGTRPAPRTYGERRTNLIARLEAKHGG